jgi:hypothetical protein
MEWVQNNPWRCGARRLQKSYTAMEPEQRQLRMKNRGATSLSVLRIVAVISPIIDCRVQDTYIESHMTNANVADRVSR